MASRDVNRWAIQYWLSAESSDASIILRNSPKKVNLIRANNKHTPVLPINFLAIIDPINYDISKLPVK